MDDQGRVVPVELHQKLGAGAFGEVYLARMEIAGRSQRWVAIKLLKAHITPDDSAAYRMRFEAATLAQINHQNVPTIHGLYRMDTRYALVTEYIDGQDLTACIHGTPAIPPSTILEVVRDVASALEEAFSHDVVHRDVKPSNIRVGRQGFVKLLDFGVARPVLLDDRDAHTQEDTVVGTRLYLSPERLVRVNETPQPSSDIFALGCVLFEGITRKHFLSGLTFPNQVHLSTDGPKWDNWLQDSLALVDPVAGVPDGTKNLLRAMLAFRASSRPPAHEVIQRCDEMIQRYGVRHVGLKQWCREREWPTSPISLETPAAPQRTETFSSLDIANAETVQQVRPPRRPTEPTPTVDPTILLGVSMVVLGALIVALVRQVSCG